MPIAISSSNSCAGLSFLHFQFPDIELMTQATASVDPHIVEHHEYLVCNCRTKKEEKEKKRGKLLATNT